MKKNEAGNKSKILTLLSILLFLALITYAQEISFETPMPEDSEGCIETWICSKWSECSDAQRTRTCTDSNACGTTKDKSAETKSCVPEDTTKETKNVKEDVVSGEKGVKEEPVQQEEGSSFFSSWTFKIIVVAFLLLVCISIVYFIYQRKTPSTPQKSTTQEQKNGESKTVTPVEETTIDPKLLKYIKINSEKGFTKEQIKAELIKAGWDTKSVDEALAKF